MAKRYVGGNEISKVVDTEKEYLVLVEFRGGERKWELMNREVLQAVETPKPIDPTDLQVRRLTFIGKQLMVLLLHYNMKMTELEPLMQRLIYSFKETEDKLLAYALRREGEDERDLGERTMQDMEDALTKHRVKPTT